jgi:hypothetical protein
MTEIAPDRAAIAKLGSLGLTRCGCCAGQSTKVQFMYTQVWPITSEGSLTVELAARRHICACACLRSLREARHMVSVASFFCRTPLSSLTLLGHWPITCGYSVQMSPGPIAVCRFACAQVPCQVSSTALGTKTGSASEGLGQPGKDNFCRDLVG